MLLFLLENLLTSSRPIQKQTAVRLVSLRFQVSIFHSIHWIEFESTESTGQTYASDITQLWHSLAVFPWNQNQWTEWRNELTLFPALKTLKTPNFDKFNSKSDCFSPHRRIAVSPHRIIGIGLLWERRAGTSALGSGSVTCPGTDKQNKLQTT